MTAGIILVVLPTVMYGGWLADSSGEQRSGIKPLRAVPPELGVVKSAGAIPSTHARRRARKLPNDARRDAERGRPPSHASGIARGRQPVEIDHDRLDLDR